MTDTKKTFKDRVDEFLQGIVDALESLVAPQPELVPVRAPRRPYRR